MDFMAKYDYSNGKIDKSDRKRLYFFDELSDMLTMYDSSSEEVNELIYWLYYLSRGLSYKEPKSYETKSDYELQPDKQFDENTFIRNVWNNDMIIYSIVATVNDNNSWETKDDLTDIIRKIYFILDKIIHPNPRPGLDYEDTRYYVEVEYINKEEQERLKKEHNLDFKEEDWRA